MTVLVQCAIYFTTDLSPGEDSGCCDAMLRTQNIHSLFCSRRERDGDSTVRSTYNTKKEWEEEEEVSLDGCLAFFFLFFRHKDTRLTTRKRERELGGKGGWKHSHEATATREGRKKDLSFERRNERLGTHGEGLLLPG